jgi:hypothetical protein
VNNPIELKLVHAKLSGPFRERATIELGSETRRIVRAAFQPDELIEGLSEKFAIHRHRCTSPRDRQPAFFGSVRQKLKRRMIRLTESGLLNAMLLFGVPIRPHMLPLLSVVDGHEFSHAGRAPVGLDFDADAVGDPRPAPSPGPSDAGRARRRRPGGATAIKDDASAAKTVKRLSPPIKHRVPAGLK